MTVLLLWKEHLKEIYNKYSYVIRFVVRLLLILCTILSMNANIGYMAKLKNPVVVALLCFWSLASGQRGRLPYRMCDGSTCVCSIHGNGTDHTDDDPGSGCSLLWV